jgi:hypothetical protein
MIDASVGAVVEVLFEGTGRRLFGPLGKQPHSVVDAFHGNGALNRQELLCRRHST